MKHTSLNHTYRLIWNDTLNAFVAVAEFARSRGKSSGKAARLLATGLALGGLVGGAWAGALPTSGQVVAGNGAISQSGNTMTINQSSGKMAIDWQSFSIGQGNTVNFVQPSASSVALNRVLGSDVSVIQGALNANGQVFVINPNGVLFSPTAQVNVGGLVASTLGISNTDFLAGKYSFAGHSSNAIINQGNITAANGGTIALIAAKITNDGNLTATGGNVLLGAGSKVTLDMGGPVKLAIENDTLETLIQNGGAIRADGGTIWLTSQAASTLASSVINNTGLIEAQTLATGEKGEIVLYAHGGQAHIGGTLDASAPHGGNGGFIETSGTKVSFDRDVKVTTAATNGTTGQWLIDPQDFTIAATGGDITGADLSTLLGSNSVTIQTSTTGTNSATTLYGATSGNGDIFVNDNVAWASNNTLTLNAYRNITVSSNITHTGTAAGGVIFLFGQGSATGGTATYTATGTVTSPSLQWRKGSDANSLRWAMVDGNYFLGNQYIELGLCGASSTECSDSGQEGKFGTSNKPSLFFGRQGGNAGIGMVGDADGFGVGADLRIDYFLPGSPAEQFSSYFTGAASTAKNFASLANAGTFSLDGIGADGSITMRYAAVQEGKLKVEQTISLKASNQFFNNTVTLTNVDSSALAGVVFARSFDPDNTVDIGGDYENVQKIEQTIASGDSANVVSATSSTGDAYATASGGNTAKIIYYATDSNTTVGYGGDFFGGSSIPSMVSAAASLSKGNSQTADDGIGILYAAGTLLAGASKTFSYLTSLDNRDMSAILTDLGTASSAPTPTPTPTPTPAPAPAPTPTPSAPEQTAIANVQGVVGQISGGAVTGGVSSGSTGAVAGSGSIVTTGRAPYGLATRAPGAATTDAGPVAGAPDLSGGLAFLDVPVIPASLSAAPAEAFGSGPSNTSSNSSGNSGSLPAVDGRAGGTDPNGFMTVFRVAGGVNYGLPGQTGSSNQQ